MMLVIRNFFLALCIDVLHMRVLCFLAEFWPCLSSGTPPFLEHALSSAPILSPTHPHFNVFQGIKTLS
eukprot:1151367-Pelagomonas_calceolata.AAC.6